MKTIVIEKDSIFRGEPLNDKNRLQAEQALRLMYQPERIEIQYK